MAYREPMTTQLKPVASGAFTTVTKKSGQAQTVAKTSVGLPAAPYQAAPAQLAANLWLFGAQTQGGAATGNAGAGVGSYMLYAQKLAAASGIILKEI